MKQILRYLKPYLGKLLAATVLIALSTLCDLLLPDADVRHPQQRRARRATSGL